MNDIQTKENIYSVAWDAVKEQKESFFAAQAQANQAKSKYLNAVVQTALASERLRRKKDSMVTLISIGIIAAIILIPFLINPIIGGTALLVITIVILFAVRGKKSEERTANYNNRKEFFSKYAYAIPTNESLKWKKTSATVNISLVNSSDSKTAEWVCATCSAKNSNAVLNCTACGTRKSQ